MYIDLIALKNYRNYEDVRIEPCRGVTVLTGDNAQGKTNALESVYLCCTGRSHRTSHDRELIRTGSEVAYVKVSGVRRDGRHDVEISLSESGRRQVKVNASPVRRSGELLGHITGVLFAPEDLRMVKDGPSVRRRFMDMELSQLRPSYYYALQRYNRALKQRNALLKEALTAPVDPESFDVWERELSLSGAEIVQSRVSFVGKLADSASDIHASITAGKETLRVTYEPSVPPGESLSETKDNLAKQLLNAREKDIKRGLASFGVHRDDLGIFIGDMDARSYGSQGQVRTCALSLKLSEIELIQKETGEAPVLMLDDVMSELDPDRRRQLVKRLDGVQALITCTDKNDLAGAEIGKLFHVKNAILTEEV